MFGWPKPKILTISFHCWGSGECLTRPLLLWEEGERGQRSDPLVPHKRIHMSDRLRPQTQPRPSCWRIKLIPSADFMRFDFWGLDSLPSATTTCEMAVLAFYVILCKFVTVLSARQVQELCSSPKVRSWESVLFC